MIDVIIPCYGISEEKINKIKLELSSTSFNDINFIIINKRQSVVKNRLEGLEQSTADIVFMSDDDIFNLDKDWDLHMLNALEDSDIGIVGVNVIDNRYGNSTFGDDTKKQTHICGCLFAYKRNDELYNFDINYIKSQVEDTDFCFQVTDAGLSILYLGNVKINHRFEGKNKDVNLENVAYFTRKWGCKP